MVSKNNIVEEFTLLKDKKLISCKSKIHRCFPNHPHNSWCENVALLRTHQQIVVEATAEKSLLARLLSKICKFCSNHHGKGEVQQKLSLQKTNCGFSWSVRLNSFPDTSRPSRQLNHLRGSLGIYFTIYVVEIVTWFKVFFSILMPIEEIFSVLGLIQILPLYHAHKARKAKLFSACPWNGIKTQPSHVPCIIFLPPWVWKKGFTSKKFLSKEIKIIIIVIIMKIKNKYLLYYSFYHIK